MFFLGMAGFCNLVGQIKQNKTKQNKTNKTKQNKRKEKKGKEKKRKIHISLMPQPSLLRQVSEPP